MKSFIALPLFLGIVSSASIPTEQSQQSNITTVTFSHNFSFLHADEICSWSGTLDESMLLMKEEFCIGREAKPEYTDITECFIAGGVPINDLFEQKSKNASCQTVTALYLNYIQIASRSCPAPVQTSKIAARGVMVELALAHNAPTTEREEAACYIEIAQNLYSYFEVESGPPASTSAPNWPSGTTTPGFPKPIPTAEPYPVPVPCGSGQ